MSLRPSVQPAPVPHHAVLSPRAVAVLGCGWNRDVGATMPCGVAFITDKVSFVVTTKSRRALDPNGVLFDMSMTTPQMEAVANAMNEAASPTTYTSIFVFKQPIDEETLLSILPTMTSRHYESKLVRKAFANVQTTLSRGFGPDSSMVMFRYNY